MSITKIIEVLDKNFDKYDKISSHWKNFLERETYLTHIEKMEFIKQLKKVKRLNNLPWYFFFFKKLRRKIQDFYEIFEKLKKEISPYNSKFIENRLEEYSSFFNGKDDNLKYSLDAEQRIAIIKDDKHNLVIAAAGSGKTSVIASRIAYLIRRKVPGASGKK